MLLGEPIVVNGSSYTPTSDLPTGVVFWRLHPSGAMTVTSATWQFVVGPLSAPIDTSWGTTLDVNGDGLADLAVGDSSTSMRAGSVYLYLGGVAGYGSEPPRVLSSPLGANEQFGLAVAGAGDVNGDGYADLVVGAPGVPPYTDPGHVYLYLGGPSGLEAKPLATLSIEGQSLGYSVASAGDLNGDGYADVAVGVAGGGTVYVYLGSAKGLLDVPATVLTPANPAVTQGFGIPIASAGDVNGDGFADLVVGAATGPSVSPTPYRSRAFVYLGSPMGLPSLPSTTLEDPTDPQAQLYFGAWVACAGDVNGDGYSDVYVAEFDNATAYVYLGGGDGLDPSTPIVLRSPEGSTSDDFGGTVASGGDFNGDGYSDLVVPTAEHAYLYEGSVAGLAATPSLALTSGREAGTGYGFIFAGNAGDVNGDGYTDLTLTINTTGVTPSEFIDVYSGGSPGLIASPTATLHPTGVDGNFGAPLFGASN
jgi:FG-GAP-like repeat/FG-GAP repeat